MQSLVFLDPISTFLLHLLLDVSALIIINLSLQVFLSIFESVPELLLLKLSILLGFLHSLNGIVFHLFLGLRFPCHSQEHHLLLAHFLNFLTCQNTSKPFLDDQSIFIIELSVIFLFDETFFDLALLLLMDHLIHNTLEDDHYTITTLTTSLILLDQSYR